jgi:hypothetical protein
MKRQTGVDKKVEDALSSLDGIKRSDPQPWFYTRVKARLEPEEHTAWMSIGSFLSRPSVAFATLGGILVLNAFVLFRQDTTDTVPASAIIQNELTTDNEYILASSSSYEFENIVQQ